MISEICEIIQSISTDVKDPRAMQKVAGDIETIEKICELLIANKVNEENIDMANGE